MSEEKKSLKELISLLSPLHSFLIGILGGLLVLCTVGFFVLIPIVLNCDGTCKAENTEELNFKAPEKFSQCLDSNKYADTVKNDIALGTKFGVNGTPATFINGYLLSGALPIEEVKGIVDEILAGKEPSSEYLSKDEQGKLLKVDIKESDLSDVFWAGNKKATVTLVEFSDFECPYCTRFSATVEQLLADYGDKIKFTFRNFPLSFHANAQKAAEAFECAKEQGKALEMHNKLFELSGNDSLSINNYKKAASELGLK
ncbi:MAG: thioredoxin domain-containing protein [Patescibacteria group bacterium]